MSDELGRCWLIGGTSDSAAIAERLTHCEIPFVVTVTTASARNLYPSDAQVHVGKLSPQLAQSFAGRYEVRCIADASHPFASEISRCAIALSKSNHLPYLRYERPYVESISALSQTSLTLEAASKETVIRADSIDSLVDSPLLRNQRVLFTIGYRHLEKFSGLRATSKLYARILPSSEAIANTLAAGFSASEIVALRPPISLALETALWQQWNISCVVAKASGQLAAVGSGEQIKRQAAQALGTQLIIINRPAIAYPHKTERIEEIVSFCQKHSASTHTTAGTYL